MYAKSTRPSAKRDDQIARTRRAQACERSELRAIWMCPRSGQIFVSKIHEIWFQNLGNGREDES